MAFQAIRTAATSRLFRGTRQLHFLRSSASKRLGNGQAVVFHHSNAKVRPGKYGSWLGRMAWGTFAFTSAYHIYHYFVISPLAQATEALSQIAAEEGEEEEEEDEDSAIFLPLPLTTKEVIPPPYSRSDPEWAEFTRISKDKELIQHMRASLVSHVLSATSNHQILIANFGKPHKVHGFFLELDYPLYPPPIHTQLGILITDAVVAIAMRERESEAARLEERVLWPRPMIMASWAVISALMTQSKDSILGALLGGDVLKILEQPGLASDPPPAIASATTKPSEVQKAMQTIRQQATRRPGEVPPPEANVAPSGDKALPKTASRGPANGSSTAPSPAQAPVPAPSSPKSKDDKVDKAPRELSLPSKIFWHAYSKAFKPLIANPPRGSVPVMGCVQVETPKAWLYIDVIGWWDPKEKDYHKGSMVMGLSRVRSKVIRPLR